MARVRIAVVGATGYTGGELVRLLLGHPTVEIAHLSARTPRDFAEVFPALAGAHIPPVVAFDADRVAGSAEFAFLALPHGAAHEAAQALLARGLRVIDLSADYRLPRPDAGTGGKVPYGLPELFREEIRGARLVANPGCYPTAALLALGPLLAAGVVERTGIAIHAASGVSGAGRTLSRADLLLAEAAENYRPYGLPIHRHTHEIEHHASRCHAGHAAGGEPIPLTFIPHLLPFRRGILESIYLRPKANQEKIHAAWEAAYSKEPFVRILPPEKLPEIRAVRGTNRCDLALHLDDRTGCLVLFSAIDNLVKGAAGQAIQNLNLLLDFPETTGLPRFGEPV